MIETWHGLIWYNHNPAFRSGRAAHHPEHHPMFGSWRRVGRLCFEGLTNLHGNIFDLFCARPHLHAQLFRPSQQVICDSSERVDKQAKLIFNRHSIYNLPQNFSPIG